MFKITDVLSTQMRDALYGHIQQQERFLADQAQAIVSTLAGKPDPKWDFRQQCSCYSTAAGTLKTMKDLFEANWGSYEQHVQRLEMKEQEARADKENTFKNFLRDAFNSVGLKA